MPATAGALSAAVPLFYIAEKAMMKEGTRFRRKICGLLPWILLLSLEDVRLLAGELFFFRRRKKNQERRHPFERVDGTREKQRPLENRLFGDVNRGTASLNAPAVAGTAPCGADSR